VKSVLKWLFIVVLGLVLALIIYVLGVFISHDRYGFYPSGGKISPLQSQYDALAYELNLEILPEEQALEGNVGIRFRSTTAELKDLEVDLIDNFKVFRVLSASQELNFKHAEDKITITLAKPLGHDEEGLVQIFYSGQPVQAIRPPWIGGFNWSRDAEDNHWIGVSCQGEGGRLWFPCKVHPSDEPEEVRLNITVPEPYVCAANGVLKETTEPRPGFRTFHWETLYPINNYNITVNVAPFKTIQTSYLSIENREVPVVYYHITSEHNQAQELVEMAIDMVKTLETFFGEFPFADEKFGLVETDYLGMEHQTLNSYGNGYKMTRVAGHEFDSLMLHEMAHEWWGNKLTADDWADFWLHEGFGTYSEALYLLRKTGETGYHEHMSTIQARVQNKYPILANRPAKSSETYGGDIYFKGACVLHSLRFIMGDETFFQTLYQFITLPDHTYQNHAITSDFINLVHSNTDLDLNRFFHLYLETTQLPQVDIQAQSQGKWRIALPNLDFHLPMEVELDGVISRMDLSQDGLIVDSQAKPKLDPKNWYLLETLPEKQ